MITWLKTLTGRPKPVLTSASLAATITTIVGLLVTFGLLPAAQGQPIITASNTIIGSAFTIFTAFTTVLAALHASTKVTPVADPQNNQGKPLVPVTVASTLANANPAPLSAQLASVGIADVPWPTPAPQAPPV